MKILNTKKDRLSNSCSKYILFQLQFNQIYRKNKTDYSERNSRLKSILNNIYSKIFLWTLSLKAPGNVGMYCFITTERSRTMGSVVLIVSLLAEQVRVSAKAALKNTLEFPSAC